MAREDLAKSLVRRHFEGLNVGRDLLADGSRQLRVPHLCTHPQMGQGTDVRKAVNA